MKKLLYCIYGFLPVNNSVKNIFSKYKPDLVFSTDIYHPDDRELIKESKKRGIYTVGMVRSWDNITTKGVLLAVPDKIIVTSEVLKSELYEYNRINLTKVIITGIPHYDACISPRKVSREKFFEKLGLDPNKKLILIAPAGTILYKYDGGVLKLLQELKNRHVFFRDVQFLVRLPIGSGIYQNDFEPDGDFVFDNPGFNAAGGNGDGRGKKYSELTKEGAEHLNNSLYYSDIAITLTSTIAIDAAVFDRPAIIFSIKQNKSDDIKKFLKYEHYKKFTDFSFCRLATSESELVNYINGYLQNPELDRDKREELVKKYCYKLDGNSSKRVAKVLLESIGLV
jgi:CDP-glycerol glycerophosphotransferase (TagB/SpsB family)